MYLLVIWLQNRLIRLCQSTLPTALLTEELRRWLQFLGRYIKKVDQESEVCQDDLDLLTAAFRDSNLPMQAQVLQQPSFQCLASCQEHETTFLFNILKKNLNIKISLMLRVSKPFTTTICIWRTICLCLLKPYFFYIYGMNQSGCEKAKYVGF